MPSGCLPERRKLRHIMKHLLEAPESGSLKRRAIRISFGLLLALSLSLLLWTATTPLANAREMSPGEMLQAALPPNKSLTNASKPEVLSAVCSAVKKSPKSAAQIVHVAVAGRKNLSGEIASTAARCLGGNQHCDLVAEAVAAAAAESPENSSAILEQVLAVAPDCRALIERAIGGRAEGNGNFGDASANNNPPPGSTSGGGGGFNPQEGQCQVCHTDGKSGKRTTLTIACRAVPDHIRHGDTEGACPVTPTQNP